MAAAGEGPTIELFRPDGTRFESASVSIGSTARIDGVLDQTGTWTILVSETANDNTASYTIALERVAPPSPSAAPGTPPESAR